MIRRATVDDIRPIYDMIEAYHKEALPRFPFLKWNQEKVVIQLGTWLWRDTAFNFISDDGFVLGELMETWWGGDWVGVIHALYVKPESRNGLLARKLLREFEEHVEARQAVGVTWDNFGGITDSRMLDGFVKHCGYKVHGSVYLKLLGGFENDRLRILESNTGINESRRDSRE